MNDKSKRNFMMKPDEQPPFAAFMGMKITHVSPERVTAELLVTRKSDQPQRRDCTAAR